MQIMFLAQRRGMIGCRGSGDVSDTFRRWRWGSDKPRRRFKKSQMQVKFAPKNIMETKIETHITEKEASLGWDGR